jgi:hypothetical protein
LIIVTILSVALLVASIYRSGTIGWLPSMYFQIAAYITVCLTVAFLKRIPYACKAMVLILVCFILGSTGILDMGLSGSGMLFLLFAIILASMLLSVRLGWILIAGGLAVLATIAVGVSQGWIR